MTKYRLYRCVDNENKIIVEIFNECDIPQIKEEMREDEGIFLTKEIGEFDGHIFLLGYVD